jgi:glucosyl-dolichyl phosphate glucuronosyltransferase
LDLSIVICTRDRCTELRKTLAAIFDADVPAGLDWELLVVDNGSTDETSELLKRSASGSKMLRHVTEPRRGKGNAYNRALAEVRGHALLFADDDVRPRADWISRMMEPLLSDEADAVAGGIEIAPHLLRPWMTKWHRVALASSEDLDPKDPDQMIGANMAFSRKVLEKVPAFDVELGPGAMGFGEETIFSMQLREAGFRVKGGLDVKVEHHPDPRRLRRTAWLDYAERAGKVKAYTDYHWHHREPRVRAHREAFAKAKLWRRRLLHRHEEVNEEGCPHWEMSLLSELSYYRHLRVEARRPRNYERHGLVKLRGELPRINQSACV